MEKNFKELKEQANKRIKGKKTELEEIKTQFIKAVIPFAEKWIENHTKFEATKQYPEITKSLGQKLKNFKDEIRDLAKSLPELTKSEFSKEDYWTHYELSDQWINYLEYRFSGNAAPKKLDKGIRFVIGSLGPILEKYGYLQPGEKKLNGWKEWDESGEFKKPDNRPYYPFGIDWNQEMREISDRYAEGLENLNELYSELKELIRKEEQFRANKLWESS